MLWKSGLTQGNTPYEDTLPFYICLGTITSVNAETRRCVVATMISSDCVFKDATWLSTDCNPDGDESGSIPRVNSMGLVFVIHGQAYIWGFMPPVTQNGSAKNPNNKLVPQPGDKFLATKEGNRVRLAISGLIELYASDTLQRLMYPVGSKIVDICREYRRKTDGTMTVAYMSEPVTGNTLHTAEFSNNIARAFTVYEQKGYVSSTIISKTSIGPVIPITYGSSTPTYLKTINISGEVTTAVSPPQPEFGPAGFKSIQSPDGSVQYYMGRLQQTTLKVESSGDASLVVNKLPGLSPAAEATIDKTGEIAIKNKMASATISSKGDIEIKNVGGAKISISATGAVQIESKAKTTITGGTGVDITAILGPIKVEGNSATPMIVKNKMGPVQISGAAMPGGAPQSATDYVLCWPTTLSPFTGSPLMPYSKSVMVSK